MTSSRITEDPEIPDTGIIIRIILLFILSTVFKVLYSFIIIIYLNTIICQNL